MLVALEEGLGIEFEPEEMDELRSVAADAEALAKKGVAT